MADTHPMMALSPSWLWNVYFSAFNGHFTHFFRLSRNRTCKRLPQKVCILCSDAGLEKVSRQYASLKANARDALRTVLYGSWWRIYRCGVGKLEQAAEEEGGGGGNENVKNNDNQLQ